MNEIEKEDRALAIGHFVRKPHEAKSVTSLLEVLKIPFKKGKQSFWVINEAELEYIYVDFQKAVRYALRDLHPQNGGDPYEFGEFAKLVAQTRHAFEKRGIGKDITLFAALEKQEKEEKQKEKHQPKTDRRHYDNLLDSLDGLQKLSTHDDHLPNEYDGSAVTFTPIEQVRKNHRAALARERRKRNRNKFRAQRRERYQRLKAEGSLPKYDLERSRRYYRKHRRKLKNAGRRYREENREKVNQWKRNYYWRKKGFAEPPPKIKKPKKRGLNRRICQRCGEKFKPKSRIQKHCNTKCYRAAKSQRRLERLRSIPKPEKILLSKTCQLEGCDIVFQSSDARQMYCCKEHGTKAGNQRRQAKFIVERPMYERLCLSCNQLFATTHAKKIYCSDRCSHKVAQRKFREKNK